MSSTWTTTIQYIGDLNKCFIFQGGCRWGGPPLFVIDEEVLTSSAWAGGRKSHFASRLTFHSFLKLCLVTERMRSLSFLWRCRAWAAALLRLQRLTISKQSGITSRDKPVRVLTNCPFNDEILNWFPFIAVCELGDGFRFSKGLKNSFS